MKLNYLLLLTLPLICCSGAVVQPNTARSQEPTTPKLVECNSIYSWLDNPEEYQSLADRFSPPSGFIRTASDSSSFGSWLRCLPLKSEGTKVFLYDGALKWSQQTHAAVVAIDVGKKDLQQCADAVMRMRAEYLYAQQRFKDIHFNYTNGDKISYPRWANGEKPVVKGNTVAWQASSSCNKTYSSFRTYMNHIFMYAGTASLSKELKSVGLSDMQPGDVFIQGGHPGHAVLVLDMAESESGEKLYMLAQSYMPAQDFHVLVNPSDADLSPWYEFDPDAQRIDTPEWGFTANDLKRF